MESAKKNLSLEEWNKTIEDWVAQLNSDAEEKVYKELIWEGQGINDPVEAPSHGLTNRDATPDLIRKAAMSVGDFNPLWRNPNYAANTRWGGVIAPPFFIQCIAFPSIIMPSVPALPKVDFYDAGLRVENYFPIRPYDQFTASFRQLGVQEKKSSKERPYRMFASHVEVNYYNQDGLKVAVGIGGFLITIYVPGYDQMKEGASGGALKKSTKVEYPHYDEATLNEIYKHYEGELDGTIRRGAKPLYFEDVNVGDEVQTMLKGPLDESDLFAYCGVTANMMYPPAFTQKMVGWKNNPARSVISETGARRMADIHGSESIALQIGFPAPVAYGGQSEAMISHAITNWAGDDAFVRMMDFQCRKTAFVGDTSTIVGKVVKKYEEGEKKLIDLELENRNQNGVAHTTCKATVELLARK